MERVFAYIFNTILLLIVEFFRLLPALWDAAVYGVQWLTIAYTLFLLAYNLALAIRRRIRRIPGTEKKFRKWPRLFFKGLRFLGRKFLYFLQDLPWTLLQGARRLGAELAFYGRLVGSWCAHRWSAWELYRWEASLALRQLWGCLDLVIFLEHFSWRHLWLIVRGFWGAFFRLYGEALRGHWTFIGESAVRFLERPLVHEWTIFRLVKHFLGITFAISFFYYGFLWCAYALYIVCDCIFLFIHVVCFHLLQPLFFWGMASENVFFHTYAQVVGPPRHFIMVVLFEDLPARVKARKDRIFSKATVGRLLLRPLERWLERLLWNCTWGLYHLVTVKAYYQTRYLVWHLWRRGRSLWHRSYRYRRKLRRLRPKFLVPRVRLFLGRLFQKIWWRYAFFFLRDLWRWFSFVCRRYIFLPRWRKWQYRWRKGRVRFLFKLRYWAVYVRLFSPLLFWGGLLALGLFFFFA